MTFDAPDRVAVRSQQDVAGQDWTTHATIHIAKQAAVRERKTLSIDNIETAMQNTRHVSGDELYSVCGNGYLGYYQSVKEAWMGPEGMLVRLVEHDDATLDAQQLQAAYAFRPNALIDSASQPGILQVDHRGRAFMLADWSDAYATFVADWNGTLGWAHCTPAGVFTMYNPQKEFVLEMSTGQRGQMVFLEVGQMERERVQRHMYEVQRGSSRRSQVGT